MAVDQLPGRMREFGNYLSELLARLDQRSGWCAVFWQRDPDGLRACLDGYEVAPWDVVEALLQDLAAAHGPATAARDRDRARALHAAALIAYDARPGARDDLGDRLDIMLREQRYAADRLAQLGRALVGAATRQESDALRLDLAWARDDHDRAGARCAELRHRIDRLEHARAGSGQPWGAGSRERGEGPPPPGASRARTPAPSGTDDLPRPAAPRAEGWSGAVAGGVARIERRPEGRDGREGRGGRDGGAGRTPEEPFAPPELPEFPDPPDLPDHPPDPSVPPEPSKPAKSKKRARGSARFAGMLDDAETDTAPAAPVPPTAAPVPPDRLRAPAPQTAPGSPRGARFAGATDAATAAAQPSPPAFDAVAAREITETVHGLVRLRRQGRSGEAHALLAEVAHWPAERFAPLAAELERAGMAADWATLLWEAGSLPAEQLVAAADALAAGGRGADGQRILRQGVARPAGEIGRDLVGLVADGRQREVRVLLDAYVRVRTPEEAVRSTGADPDRLVPLLLEAARGVSEERYWDLVHALRVAGIGV
ncbi:hypothetical protein ABZX40_35695 [Streptomyces sp. NPDC004610]|uniref:hypothetical protein n=1 Tax=unclassified Streptomyces TaxID=2593676 RepID=UPI00339FC9C1